MQVLNNKKPPKPLVLAKQKACKRGNTRKHMPDVSLLVFVLQYNQAEFSAHDMSYHVGYSGLECRSYPDPSSHASAQCRYGLM